MRDAVAGVAFGGRSALRRSLLDPFAVLGHRAIRVGSHLAGIVRLAGQVVLNGAWVGLERPSRGSVEVFGFDLRQAAPGTRAKIRKRWGVLFQEGGSRPCASGA